MSLLRRHPLLWLGLIAAAVLALAAGVTASTTVAWADGAVVKSVHLNAVEPPLTDWILALTSLADTGVVLAITVGLVALLAGLRHWHGALILGLSVVLTHLIVDVAKDVVSRPRPADAYAVGDPSGFSFPSGHSAISVALYATAALIAARALSGSARVAVAVAGAVVVLAVGISRVYLGAHYPTDVLAGWLTGAAVVLACWAAVSRLRPAARLASG
jgi:undecaprenyl-diphosphatase